ncbi:hypothetical protein FB554_1339 [Barrientosiimonas humi]|uniref:Uncharacterized protein n=1 Tax=Barrientosiimonas humi TaxID=999931 RepID=A0A542XBI9_9MICO|nr:hypothetical protein [Barrientosiimonas humi]TQL33203.1 hypothetical protein FB554_1339 [Barrientosiimonas humi]CAG7573192.1 hypothetical protein BH39T_PBIAJDOK_01818 [Barrientosiimonas humi]
MRPGGAAQQRQDGFRIERKHGSHSTRESAGLATVASAPLGGIPGVAIPGVAPEIPPHHGQPLAVVLDQLAALTDDRGRSDRRRRPAQAVRSTTSTGICRSVFVWYSA